MDLISQADFQTSSVPTSVPPAQDLDFLFSKIFSNPWDHTDCKCQGETHGPLSLDMLEVSYPIEGKILWYKP